MRSARYAKEKGLKLLVQAYAFIGLAIIVTLILSSAEGPALQEHPLAEGDAPSEGGLFSRFRSLFAITGAAVDETAEEELPEVQEEVPDEAAEPLAETTEQFTLAFEPADARSLTTLATSGELHIGTVTVANKGDDVSNVKLSIRSPEALFTPKEVELGTLESGESISDDITLDFSDEAVSYDIERELPESGTIVLRFALGYADSDNVLHQQSSRALLPVRGHHIVENAPHGYARFVPESDSLMDRFVAEHLGGVRAKSTLESQRLSARWIFESLQTLNIEVLPDSQNEVRFPVESLSKKKATPTDFAVLYAALLHSAGFDAALISRGERLLAAYVDTRGYIVPVVADAPDYEEGLTQGVALIKDEPYSTLIVKEEWKKYPSAKFPSEELSIGKWPSMTRQVGRCALEPLAEGISKAKVPVRFSNTGTAAGIGCVGLVSYEGEQRSGKMLECYTVRPGLVLDTELSTRIIGNSPSCEEI